MEKGGVIKRGLAINYLVFFKNFKRIRNGKKEVLAKKHGNLLQGAE